MQTRFFRTIVMLLVVVMSVTISGMALTYQHHHVVALHRQPLTEGNVELDPEGHRLPGRPVTCVLTESTIECSALNIDDIVSYEIHTSNGDSIGIFFTPDSFLSVLFTLSGEYRISFRTDEVIFLGYIQL